MTHDDRSLERAARSWLEEGPKQAPDRVVESALSHIQTTTQERDLVPWRLPKMNVFSRAVAGVAALAVVVAVGVFIARPGPGVGGPGATPTPTPAITALGTASPAPTPSDAACQLLTSDEVRAASGNPGLGAQPGAAGQEPTTSCIYTSGGGDIVARIDLTRPGGAVAFSAAKARPGMQVIAGLGADAVFDPAFGALYVGKGDSMAAITAGFLADTSDKKVAETSALARLLIPRL
jgi:hypothetical protein